MCLIKISAERTCFCGCDCTALVSYSSRLRACCKELPWIDRKAGGQGTRTNNLTMSYLSIFLSSTPNTIESVSVKGHMSGSWPLDMFPSWNNRFSCSSSMWHLVFRNSEQGKQTYTLQKNVIHNTVTCMGVTTDELWLAYWVYWPLDITELHVITALSLIYALKLTVTQTQGFSVFPSCNLATDFNTVSITRQVVSSQTNFQISVELVAISVIFDCRFKRLLRFYF
jgi:hypothetical protein